MATQVPLINGRAFAWADVQVVLFGNVIKGIRAISYKEKQDKKDQMASGIEPSSRVYGPKEYSGSIELEMKEVERIRDAIVGTDKSLLNIPPFTITVSYTNNYKNVTHKIQNVEFTEDGNDLKASDAVNVTIPLIYAGIDYGQ